VLKRWSYLYHRYTHPEKSRCPRSAVNLEFRVVLDAPTGLFVFVCDPLTDNRQWAAILADCGARLSADVTKVAEIMQHLRWHLAAQFVEDVARELPLRLMQLAPITTTDIEVARKDGTPHLRFQLCHYPQYFLHLTLSEERNVECVRPSVSSFFCCPSCSPRARLPRCSHCLRARLQVSTPRHRRSRINVCAPVHPAHDAAA
jgi:hypothetical protein